MELFAVTGKPVFHSKSPEMYNSAFRELSMDCRYLRVAATSPEDAIGASMELGISGLNVTSPFKDGFFAISGKKDILAKKTRSVNCALIGSKGKISGFNTDATGVSEALKSSGIDLNGVNACVIGAGGAARSAAIALLRNGAKVTVINRTTEKAKEISENFACDFASFSSADLEKTIPNCGIIVSAVTTAGAIIPEKLIPKDTVVLDANYSSKSELVQSAERKGCRVIDGREWLLFQGVKSFEIFTGKKAPLAAMRTALYAAHISPKRDVALIGFMGTGKSAVAQEIGKASGLKVVDVDANIVGSSKMGIPLIFRKFGEPHFRGLEKKEILCLGKIKSPIGMAIDCGGGAILNPGNVVSLKSHSTIVMLSASISEILGRVGNGSSRPLINPENSCESFQKLFSARIGLYMDAADLVVGTSGKNPKEISEVILREIRGSVKN